MIYFFYRKLERMIMMKKIIQLDFNDHGNDRYHVKIYANSKLMPYQNITCVLYKYHWLFEGHKTKVYKYERLNGWTDFEEITKAALVLYKCDIEKEYEEKEKLKKWALSFS
jgi:hypothetical protein